MAYALVFALSYLAGSFPSAWLAGRLAGVKDIRKEGSGNAGATNALRVLGWGYALAVLIVDAFKGAASVLFIAGLAGGGRTALAPVLAATGALLGHAFPIFLGFRGGKGVATGAGALVAMAPPILLPCLSIFLVTAFSTGYISLASMAAALAILPAYLILVPAWGGGTDPVLAAFMGGASLLVILLHRRNIGRLLAGTEERFKSLGRFRRGRRGKEK
jgi:glycerol-3-phosphate acyltransferase PlsY